MRLAFSVKNGTIDLFSMAEGNIDTSGQQAPQESLRHSPNEIVIGLTISPAGKPCIGMTFEGRDWILFTTKTTSLANNLRRQLQEELKIPSLPGLPFDFRTSLEQQKLVLLEDPPSRADKLVGIFVSADHFDDLVNSSVGT